MLSKDELRRLQLTQLEILMYVDELCRKNSIKYSLYAGTLIGAARHKGFIPWDDDLDICMERDEYNRFIKLWESHPNKDYFLQNIDNENDFTQTFSKVRKHNSAFVQEVYKNSNIHNGIFIDIFPIDRIPDSNLKRKIQFLYANIYILLSRQFQVLKKGNLINMGKVVMKSLPNKFLKIIRNFCLRKLTRFNNDKSLKCVSYCTIPDSKIYFPSYLMDDYTEIEFEGNKLPVFKEWHEWLTIYYGDYMKMPPEEERVCKHAPIYLSFNKNYQDLEG